jgi:hypothetical protein
MFGPSESIVWCVYVTACSISYRMMEVPHIMHLYRPYFRAATQVIPDCPRKAETHNIDASKMDIKLLGLPKFIR